ncbi:hypothetical protein LOTGIDRAFT_235056 [Lottia gigantea]|uniref:NAD(P)H oxidase (H2O2-forming) n=1 Tax=Lottia gigantea TaxID=225164 RepID=V4A2S8_LOTGI|nr:hypothetical protein LOTGIDRAFT_235056 [Lottia gigantea]ESO87606.1 hypothetical protein LOTGIDRAFT_235056 [Lottia gigantea]
MKEGDRIVYLMGPKQSPVKFSGNVSGRVGVKRGQDEDEAPLFELTPQDGYYNNLLHPDWGAIDGQLLRPSRPDYSDSVFEPSGTDRPNPFTVSDTAHFGEPGNGSARGRNSLLVFFGQQVVEEIMDSQRPGCPREFFNVKVPTGHPIYDREGKGNIEMPLLRTRFDQRTGYSPNNPRQQLNEITPYIDGGLMYGTSKAWTDTLRSFKNGELLAEGNEEDIKLSFPNQNDIRLPMANPPPPREHILKPVNRFYRLGNPRGNENPMLLAFGVMWFRWHNVVARKLKLQHPTWNDEQLFNRARQFVIAHHQNIVMYEWLPKWISIYENGTEENISDYSGYKPNVHPGISQEFQAAALRFGHTLVPSGIFTRKIVDNGQCKVTSNIITNGTGHNVPYTGIRVCTSFWNSQLLLISQISIFGDGNKVPLETEEPGIDSVFLGMIHTLSEKEDHIIVTDLRVAQSTGNVFGPLDFNQRDLAAINIQRGRDHGLPGYNEIRQTYGLNRLGNWSDINPDLTEILEKLRELYDNDTAPDNLDIFTGGLLETTDDGLGPLFKAITIEQFERIRDGDRFWFENRNNGIFSDAEIEEIKQITLKDIIDNTTNIGADQMSNSVFLCRNNDTIAECNCMAPFNRTAIDNGIHEECVDLSTYDYFSGSEASFALTFVALGLCVPLTIGIMIFMAKRKEKKMAEANRRRPARSDTTDPNKFSATEWVGIKSGERNVKVELDRNRKKIMVTDRTGKTLRLIDLRRTDRVHIRISDDKDQSVISVRVPGETDLILRFIGLSERQTIVGNIEKFLQDLSINRERHEFTEATIMKDAVTFDDRKKLLDTFFKVICLQAFNKNKSALSDLGIENLDLTTANEIRKIKLTRTEFAEALGLQPDSLFVRNMFLLVDRSKDGFVSFEEFLSMFVTMASGGAEDKAKLLFNMYDLKRKGELTRRDFTKMIRSMMDMADATLDDSRVDTFLDHMFEQAGIANKQTMTFDDFKKIFASEEHGEILQNATLAFDKVEKKSGNGNSNLLMRKKTVINQYRDKTFHPQSRNRESKIHIEATKKQIPMGKFQTKIYEITRYIENYRLHIFWFILFNLVTLGIFIERAYYYSIEREHAGLRRLAGYGVSVTRGAASVQMFLYVSLLVTMSRNTLTFFRETFLHRFIPFDAFHAMHKYTALLALIFTAMHIIGHGINLFHISTQASSDLNCYFREYFRATDVLATFHYWAFTTITGITGVILTLIIIVMYVFATEYGRRHLFNAFWFTHNFYVFLYIFLILHGIGRLVQDPLFPYFFLGPLVVFVLDKMVSLSRNKVEIVVKKAEILPSGVTNLVFKRPLNFDYKSGQWVRIACLDLGQSEYHPFTLTSAPQEENLSLHIRAVGPWTTNIRRVYDINNIVSEKGFPKLYLDGPFGEGHQDWYRYPVAVLVGGGIGVTPFASILKDLVQKSKMKVKFPCQKVYFLWVTRTQKSFEWMTDIIREVELGDVNNLVSVHIFITQFQQKFDLRTTMLYICERHFQKVAGQSLFTGLRATTHFGRPKFQDFLLSLAHEHDGVPQVGVFSCGPPPMTSNVDKACSSLNKLEGPTYVHHFENF